MISSKSPRTQFPKDDWSRENLVGQLRDIHLPQGIVDYQRVRVYNVAGKTNLMPPGTPLKGKPLILDVLAVPAVEGELHESSGSPRAIVKWGESSGVDMSPRGSLNALSRSVEATVISSGVDCHFERSREIYFISNRYIDFSTRFAWSK